MKKAIWVITILFVIGFSPQTALSKAGCCSRHGGVCNCQCCDGTPLSDKCAPYYPSCGGTESEPAQPKKEKSSSSNYYKKTQGIIEREQLPFGYPSRVHILYRQAYVVSYNDAYKVANWVCYDLKAADLIGASKRKDDFRPDTELSKFNRAELSDYANSGYDRGHLAPAGDMVRDDYVMSESFLLSNMTPQNPNLNRGIWETLEENERKWARQRKEIYVCDGPLFVDVNKDGVINAKDHKVIGSNMVAVPNGYFKIVYAPKQQEALAFVFQNAAYPKGASLVDQLVPIDAIELVTGFDFLSSLDDKLENKIEAQQAKGLW